MGPVGGERASLGRLELGTAWSGWAEEGSGEGVAGKLVTRLMLELLKSGVVVVVVAGIEISAGSTGEREQIPKNVCGLESEDRAEPGGCGRL